MSVARGGLAAARVADHTPAFREAAGQANVQSVADPFVVIETEVPALPESGIRDILKRHYGLAGELKPLVSERDQNFRLRCGDGRDFVLKIANATEDPQVTDFQVQALLHLEAWLERHASPIVVPRIYPTLDDRSQVMIDAGGTEHVTRVVTYIRGIPLGVAETSQRLCRRLGEYLAHLGRALESFEHPASRHGLLWDMQQAPQLRRILPHIADEAVATLAGATLDDFESCVLPAISRLRAKVIHNDFNPDNVLVDAADREVVAGVIDFGDMLHAPLIVDVAIGASYLRALSGDPLSRIAEFVAGYHAVTPLERDEIDLLPVLIRTRLAASVAILAWRASMRGADDPYLAGAVATENTAAEFLGILSEVPAGHQRRALRQVCAGLER